jgi:pimeloyl-ACP methyl ester carboxylesterase
MYYESRGVGRPLVLLHGAMSTIETSFGAVMPALARTRRLIAVEQQGHGRTPDAKRPLSYSRMAQDTALLVRKLNIENADFFDYSMALASRLSWRCDIRPRAQAHRCFPGLQQRRVPSRYRCAVDGNRAE